MTEADARAAVVAEAHSWISTPYAHRQRLKGVAVDCAQMPLAVYVAAGVIPETDVGPYSQQWFLHRSEEIYLDWVLKFAREIPCEQAQPGDFLVMQWGRTFSHGGIVIDGPSLTIIHAYVTARQVTIDIVTGHEELKNRPRRVFTPWGP